MRTPNDWSPPCPHPACVHANRMRQGNVSALATYLTHSGQRRLLRWHTWEPQFAETRAPVFCGLRTAEDKVRMALKMLGVRVDLPGICVVLGGTEATGLAWLQRAAAQAAMSNRHLRRSRPVTQGQLDALGNGIERKHAGETDAAGESLPDGAEGRPWSWSSFAPELRWMLAAMVGPRMLDTAQEVVAVTNARVAGMPACCSDGGTCSRAALIAAFHSVTTFARPGKRGRPRQPRCEPHPALL
jgi:hypothetical protein